MNTLFVWTPPPCFSDPPTSTTRFLFLFLNYWNFRAQVTWTSRWNSSKTGGLHTEEVILHALIRHRGRHILGIYWQLKIIWIRLAWLKEASLQWDDKVKLFKMVGTKHNIVKNATKVNKRNGIGPSKTTTTSKNCEIHMRPTKSIKIPLWISVEIS